MIPCRVSARRLGVVEEKTHLDGCIFFFFIRYRRLPFAGRSLVESNAGTQTWNVICLHKRQSLQSRLDILKDNEYSIFIGQDIVDMRNISSKYI